MLSLKIVLAIGIIPLMLLAGFYTYRFLNRKLRSAKGLLNVSLYAIVLLVAIAAIFYGGLVLIAWLYGYISN